MSITPYYAYMNEKRESETDSIDTDSMDHIASIYEKIKQIQIDLAHIKLMLEEQNRPYRCIVM